MRLTAITNHNKIEAAIKCWRQAFEKVGESQTHKWQIWSEKFNVALSAGRSGSKYSYGLLDRQPSAVNQASIVEINPPSDGRSQGNNQGVVAASEEGALLLLRRSQLSVPGGKVYLSEHRKLHGLAAKTVHWPDGSTEECFLVSELDKDDATIVDNTASFMRGCQLVRLHANGASTKEIDGIKNATFVAEAIGSYELSSQEARMVSKQHAPLVNRLQERLEEMGHRTANDRINRLGPDVFTFGTERPCLFELKAGCISGDYLKAVGQLFVYEQCLGIKFRKFGVFPEGLPLIVREAFTALDISIVSIRQNGDSIQFDNLPEP